MSIRPLPRTARPLARPAVGVLLGLLLIGPLAGAAQDLGTRLDRLLAPGAAPRSGDPDAAWRALSGEGQAAAEAALERWSADLPRVARRRLAALVRLAGTGASLPRACELLGDPDVEVRTTLISFLARPDHGLAEAQRRVEALAERAAWDPSTAVRRAALEALGSLDDPAAARALLELARSLPAPDRARAAASLPATPRAREAVRELVLAGFDAPAGTPRTPDDVLAAVLPLHGRLMADATTGGESARDRAPLVLGLRHPSAAVRGAAARAFERLLGRLRELGESERAGRILEGLADQGLDPRVVHYHRARLAFYPGGDPEAARLAAREMRLAGDAGPTDESLFERVLWRFRSFYLEASAELGLGHPDAAVPLFERAAALLDGLLAERLDRQRDDESRLQHVDALHQRALVSLTLAIGRLASGDASQDREVVQDMRVAHTLSLEAQLLFSRVSGDSFASWDSVLDHELSPLRLLFTGLELPGLSIARGLALQDRLGRALATVAPVEMPGFEPWPGFPPEVTDPLVDPRRRSLFEGFVDARLEQVDEEIDDLRARFMRRQLDEPGSLPPPEDELMLQRLMRARMRILNTQAEMLTTDGKELLEQRIPSSLSMWLSRDLRNEGRAREAREVAQRTLTHLEAAGYFRNYFWGLERQAQIEMGIGSSWSDEDRPQKAEEQLLQAVERLEGIEQRMLEMGLTQGQVRGTRALRCTALISLAVNANVKLRDPERALEYYERAYELRQDDFMRVLLACYRARSGRADEARALLREIRPHPQLYYNLACTHALLGESEAALEYLERELHENQGSPGARERQMEWAQDDPDLASLREDPRFQQLVGLR